MLFILSRGDIEDYYEIKLYFLIKHNNLFQDTRPTSEI